MKTTSIVIPKTVSVATRACKDTKTHLLIKKEAKSYNANIVRLCAWATTNTNDKKRKEEQFDKTPLTWRHPRVSKRYEMYDKG